MSHSPGINLKANIMTKIKEFLSRPEGYFTALFLIGSVSYLITTSALGFYWDDWQAVFLYKTNSLTSIFDYFKYDRPMSSWTYWVTFPWVPMTPLAWQILSVLIRVGAVWFLTKAFMLLWPEHTKALQWYGVLILVFPPFNLQNISVAFSQHFITMLLFSFSIYSMVKAIQTETSWRFIWGTASILSAAGHLLTMEYFIGLEGLRPFIIWFAQKTRSANHQRLTNLRRTVFISLPYLGLFAGYLYWRIFSYPMIFNTTMEDPNTPILLYELWKAPFKTLVYLANLSLQDTVYLITQSWLIPLETSLLRIDAKFNLVSWFSGLLIAGIFGFLTLSQPQPSQEPKARRKFIWQGVIIGLLLAIFGGLPVWLTDRSLLVGKWSARFSLAPMLGVSLLLVVLVYWFIENSKKQAIFFIVVSGLAIAYQMQITHKYALDWEKQRDYYWQMHWRIPAIQPNTAFFSGNVPSNYSSHHSAGFALEIMYGGENISEELTTWYFRPADAGSFYSDMVPGKPIDFTLRSLTYAGSTSNVIGVQNHMSAPACLLILDKIYAENPRMEPADRDIMALSNLERINLEKQSETMDTLIFGKELDHDWCFYFQKADLARQQKDWNSVYQLMDEAFSADLAPKQSLEYTPLLEAQYNKKDWNGVLDTSRKMIDHPTDKEGYVCSVWNWLGQSTGIQPPQEILSEMKLLMDCKIVFTNN